MTDKENDFIEEIRSLCDSNNIGFRYYKDTESNAYSFRFEKNGQVIRHRFTLININDMPMNFLLNEVNQALTVLLIQ